MQKNIDRYYCYPFVKNNNNNLHLTFLNLYYFSHGNYIRSNISLPFFYCAKGKVFSISIYLNITRGCQISLMCTIQLCSLDQSCGTFFIILICSNENNIQLKSKCYSYKYAKTYIIIKKRKNNIII